jgi:glycosyltransferase involved in cell wall biosynthesis
MISLAMPTYNGGEFLREQLDSIYGQTLLPDEVIVVDDCSTDNTIEILEEYKAKYGLIYIKNEKNLGYNKNFEKAISLCSGDYIVLSDQDDIWLPSKIEKCYNVIKNVDVNTPSLVSCFSSTNKNILAKRKETDCGIIGTWKHNLSCYTSQGCTLMFNRKLLEFIIPFHDGIMYDAYIGFIASLLGNRFYIGEQLMYYRIHVNNSFATGKLSIIERFRSNLSQTVPGWYTMERFKILTIIRDKYMNLISAEKYNYLDRILQLYETSNLKRLWLFNSIREISIRQKLKTSVLLIFKIIFNIENKS